MQIGLNTFRMIVPSSPLNPTVAHTATTLFVQTIFQSTAGALCRKYQRNIESENRACFIMHGCKQNIGACCCACYKRAQGADDDCNGRIYWSKEICNDSLNNRQHTTCFHQVRQHNQRCHGNQCTKYATKRCFHITRHGSYVSQNDG